jgi:hypothetical protein
MPCVIVMHKSSRSSLEVYSYFLPQSSSNTRYKPIELHLASLTIKTVDSNSKAIREAQYQIG